MFFLRTIPYTAFIKILTISACIIITCSACSTLILPTQSVSPIPYKELVQADTLPARNLWKHMHTPARLVPYINEVTVVGTVIGKGTSPRDGDIHLAILPAKNQPFMPYKFKKNNFLNLHCLVGEIICAGQRDFKTNPKHGVCKDYPNTVKIPRMFQKIKITGTYTYDPPHKWFEIHPITQLEILE